MAEIDQLEYLKLDRNGIVRVSQYYYLFDRVKSFGHLNGPSSSQEFHYLDPAIEVCFRISRETIAINLEVNITRIFQV